MGMDIECHDGIKIVNAEKKLLVFHCIDVVQSYDAVNPPFPDKITQDDIKLANIMGARFGKRYSKSLVNEDISFIPDVDLISLSNQDWEKYKQELKLPLHELLQKPGIACSVLTKVLHRKRPKFIPVCDSVVVKAFLGDNANKKISDTILKIMEKFRGVGINNKQIIQRIRDYLITDNQLIDLSDLRMLEVLYWMENTDNYQRLFDLMIKNGYW
jgi:hypothetical protein